MNCFLQRFEDDLIPGEDSLVYFIQMKLPLATPDMIDPLWRFMIHMVLYFMGKLSYDTWEKLTEHDNPFAHTLYDSFREHSKGVFFEGPVPVFPPPDPNLIWITRDAESARQCIQSHWCHWHVKEPDGPCHNIADGFEREDTCKKETMAQRETWKLMREVMREEWQKEERREEEKTGSRRAAI
ncbi:hypothetical protein BU16DRAFT_532095 [Lophium mytilinum]|uniref:Uncharacterized protein n=1 Tax=Lophium mytilinum TaxID=390894 RepID=A0A6A6QAD5_9PEZI|nr:hypothetical protein BU16DRAFT_532095 [Lophium mytilinum]